MRIKSLYIKNSYLLPAIALIAGLISFMGVQAVASPKTSKINCQGICVSLKDDRMIPDEMSVKVGSYVQFNADDGLEHDISVGNGAEHHDTNASKDRHDHEGGYSSGHFGKGEAWRVQFKKAGVYKLHDHHHPKQRILVVVY